MANGLMTNLLGYNPVTTSNQRLQQFLSPIQQASNPYEKIGAALGTLFGGALMGQDPELQKTSAVRSAIVSAAGQFSPNTPEYFEAIAKSLPESAVEIKARALELAEEARGKAEKSFRETQKFVGDFPEALAGEAQKVQNTVLARLKRAGVNVETDPVTGELLTPIPPEVLAQVEQLPEVQRLNQLTQVATRASMKQSGSQYETLSPEQVRTSGLNPNNIYQRDTQTGKLTQVGQSPAVVFNAPLTGAENQYAQTVGKARAESDIKLATAAETAVNNLQKINTTLTELRESKAITGPLAEIRLNVERAKDLFAQDRKAGKKVSDTEYLDALLGSDVFPMIASLGIGARGLDTPAEREYLRKVMTGSIELNKDTLIRLTELRKNIEERAIKTFNEKVDKGELNDFFKYQNKKPEKLSVPTAPRAPGSPPAGVPANIWNAMTPEERALWK